MTNSDLDDRLSTLLLESETVTQQQLQKATEYQADIGGGLGKILVKLGFLNEKELAAKIAMLNNVTYRDLSNEAISPALMALLPREMMEERLVLPIRLGQDTLTVAMADPTNLEVVEMVRFDAGYSVNPVLALETDIREKLNHYYYDGKTPPRPGRSYGLSDLVKEMKPARPVATPPPPPPAPTTTETVEALQRALLKKGILTEQEFARALREIRTAK